MNSTLSVIPDELIIITENGFDKIYYLKPLNNQVLLSISKEESERISSSLPSSKIRRFSRSEFKKMKFVKQIKDGAKEVANKLKKGNRLADKNPIKKNNITNEPKENNKWTLSKGKTMALIMGVIILGSAVTITILKNKDNNSSMPIQPDNVIDNVDDNQMSLSLYPIPERVENSFNTFDAADKYQFENKLDELKSIIDSMERSSSLGIVDYEDLENIIYMVNFVVADINHYESTRSFINGIKGRIDKTARYNSIYDEPFFLANFYGIRNVKEGKIVNAFEQHIRYVLDKLGKGINLEKDKGHLFEEPFKEQYLFLTNYIPAIIDGEEIYFDQSSNITKIIILGNFIMWNDFLMNEKICLPENIMVEMFNRKTRKMEYIPINVEKALEDLDRVQHGIMLDITTGWKDEIVGRQKGLY